MTGNAASFPIGRDCSIGLNHLRDDGQMDR